jgi:hypothetical protein
VPYKFSIFQQEPCQEQHSLAIFIVRDMAEIGGDAVGVFQIAAAPPQPPFMVGTVEGIKICCTSELGSTYILDRKAASFLADCILVGFIIKEVESGDSGSELQLLDEMAVAKVLQMVGLLTPIQATRFEELMPSRFRLRQLYHNMSSLLSVPSVAQSQQAIALDLNWISECYNFLKLPSTRKYLADIFSQSAIRVCRKGKGKGKGDGEGEGEGQTACMLSQKLRSAAESEINILNKSVVSGTGKRKSAGSSVNSNSHASTNASLSSFFLSCIETPLMASLSSPFGPAFSAASMAFNATSLSPPASLSLDSERAKSGDADVAEEMKSDDLNVSTTASLAENSQTSQQEKAAKIIRELSSQEAAVLRQVFLEILRLIQKSSLESLQRDRQHQLKARPGVADFKVIGRVMGEAIIAHVTHGTYLIKKELGERFSSFKDIMNLGIDESLILASNLTNKHAFLLRFIVTAVHTSQRTVEHATTLNRNGSFLSIVPNELGGSCDLLERRIPNLGKEERKELQTQNAMLISCGHAELLFGQQFMVKRPSDSCNIVPNTVAKVLRARNSSDLLVQLAIHGSSYGQSPTPFTLACGLLMKLGGLSKSTIDFLSKMRFTPSDATVLECMRIGCNNVLGTVKKHSQNFSFVLKCKLLVVIGDNWNKKICQHRQREGHKIFWTVPTTQVIYRLFELPRDLWRESMPFPRDMNPDNIDVVIPAVAPTIDEASIENLRPFLNSGIFPSGLADDVKDEAESRLSFWSIFPSLPLQSSVFIANVIIFFCALLLSWGKMKNFVTVLIVDQEGIMHYAKALICSGGKYLGNLIVPPAPFHYQEHLMKLLLANPALLYLLIIPVMQKMDFKPSTTNPLLKSLFEEMRAKALKATGVRNLGDDDGPSVGESEAGRFRQLRTLFYYEPNPKYKSAATKKELEGFFKITTLMHHPAEIWAVVSFYMEMDQKERESIFDDIEKEFKAQTLKRRTAAAAAAAAAKRDAEEEEEEEEEEEKEEEKEDEEEEKDIDVETVLTGLFEGDEGAENDDDDDCVDLLFGEGVAEEKVEKGADKPKLYTCMQRLKHIMEIIYRAGQLIHDEVFTLYGPAGSKSTPLTRLLYSFLYVDLELAVGTFTKLECEGRVKPFWERIPSMIQVFAFHRHFKLVKAYMVNLLTLNHLKVHYPGWLRYLASIAKSLMDKLIEHHNSCMSRLGFKTFASRFNFEKARFLSMLLALKRLITAFFSRFTSFFISHSTSGESRTASGSSFMGEIHREYSSSAEGGPHNDQVVKVSEFLKKLFSDLATTEDSKAYTQPASQEARQLPLPADIATVRESWKERGKVIDAYRIAIIMSTRAGVAIAKTTSYVRNMHAEDDKEKIISQMDMLQLYLHKQNAGVGRLILKDLKDRANVRRGGRRGGGGGGVGGVGGLVFNDIRIRTRETLNCSLSANKAVVSSALHATFSTGLINREIEVTCPEFAPMGNAYNPRACVVYIQTLLATSLQNDLVVAKLKIFDNTAVLVANDVDSVFQRGIAQANGNLTEYFAPFKPVPPGSDLEKVGEK